MLIAFIRGVSTVLQRLLTSLNVFTCTLGGNYALFLNGDINLQFRPGSKPMVT